MERRYLSHNGIERLEGVGHLTRLTTLDVANNRSSAPPPPPPPLVLSGHAASLTPY